MDTGTTRGILPPAGPLLVNGFTLGQEGKVRGEPFMHLAIVFIAHAYLQRLLVIKDVQLCQNRLIHSIYRSGMSHRHCIKPSTASGSPRSSAKLSTPQSQVFFQGAACFGGERATAHPGGVGLHYPVNLVNLLGRDACPWGRTTCRSVRRGNKRIRAKVHVQQATLCTLKEDAFGAFYRRVHVFYRITHVRFQPLCIGYVLLVYLLPG